MAEYLLDESTNMAEVAFSVSRQFQGKGLGRILMAQISGAARENGIAGLLAYTAPENEGMQRLFDTMPYRVNRETEQDVLLLSCRFDELKDTADGKT